MNSAHTVKRNQSGMRWSPPPSALEKEERPGKVAVLAELGGADVRWRLQPPPDIRIAELGVDRNLIGALLLLQG